MRKFIDALLILLVVMTVQSCDVLGGIFRAGVWVGIIIVILIIVLIIYLFGRRKRL